VSALKTDECIGTHVSESKRLFRRNDNDIWQKDVQLVFKRQLVAISLLASPHVSLESVPCL
jgi:hypothetical protein